MAKAPTVTFNGGSVSEGDSLQLDALEKTSSASENIIDIPLQVTASGSDVVTVLLTGVSDDFVFYEVDGTSETIVGVGMRLERFSFSRCLRAFLHQKEALSRPRSIQHS